ncbi:MAG TPA: PilZ domain-containing protein, partial [Thermoanaerobaculia bacterium]|nr:PilZ domain-containing protein [Thermoanaerobaculia bacterium]
VGGTFNQTRFSILQISTTGLRIRHDQTLLPGEEGKLTFALIKPPQSFLLKARVVWTSIAQRGNDPTFCISGLRVLDGVDRLRRAVDLLREARELEPQRDSGRGSSRDKTGRDSGASPQPPALRGLSDEEVASILRAVRKFAADPVEASRWYARARFAMVDEQVRAAIPQRSRDREEILGVWEYLERRIDVRKVAGVVSWMRNTRAAVV